MSDTKKQKPIEVKFKKAINQTAPWRHPARPVRTKRKGHHHRPK